MLQTILKLKPQQSFLCQGNIEVFEEILKEIDNSSMPYFSKFAPQLTHAEAQIISSYANEGQINPSIGIFYFSSYSNGSAELLLKSIEEPNINTTIIIITPYPYTFPQTLRSRMTIINEFENIFTKNSTLTRKEIINIGTKLSLSKEDANLRRESLLSFIDEIEKYSNFTKNIQLAESTYKAKKYLLKGNLAPKQVLDYLLNVSL